MDRSDTDSAVDAYLAHEFPTRHWRKYLRIYGILQGLFLQQDALVELIKRNSTCQKHSPMDLLTDALISVRGARNKVWDIPSISGRKRGFFDAMRLSSIRAQKMD